MPTPIPSAGEYSSKYYTGRRVWDGYRHMKPSLKLPAEYGSLKHDRPYPFSVSLEASERLDVQSWFAAHRSHYEGTPYDMTQGLAAGPFGTPDRYATQGTADDPGTGAWERSVAIYRTAVTWIAQAHASSSAELGGTVWWAPADSSKSVFVPLMVAGGEPPLAYTLGNPGALDRRSAYWAHRYVQNIAQIRYRDMIVDIAAASAHWERQGMERLRAIRHGDVEPKVALDAHAAQVLAATWQLADDLVGRYADGGSTRAKADGSPESTDRGYPASWLRAVGYDRAGEREPMPPGGQDPPAVGQREPLLVSTSLLASNEPARPPASEGASDGRRREVALLLSGLLLTTVVVASFRLANGGRGQRTGSGVSRRVRSASMRLQDVRASLLAPASASIERDYAKLPVAALRYQPPPPANAAGEASPLHAI